MNRVTIRQISQDDSESLHACFDSVARERKYRGFTQVASIEETCKSLVEGSYDDINITALILV